MEVDQKLKRWLERFTEWRLRRAQAREHWWAERRDADISEFWPPTTPDDIIELMQEENRRQWSREAQERLYVGHSEQVRLAWSSPHAAKMLEESQRLEAALASMDKPRSVAARLNLLFEHVTDEHGEPFTNEKVAQRSEGRLTVRKVEHLRNRTAESVELYDLVGISAAFGIDHDKYWMGLEAPLHELDPEVAEQRKLLRDYPGWNVEDTLKNDVRAYMAEQGLTYEDVAEEAGGTMHPRHLEAYLDGKTNWGQFKNYKALIEMMREVKGLSYPAWRERYIGRGPLGDLEP